MVKMRSLFVGCLAAAGALWGCSSDGPSDAATGTVGAGASPGVGGSGDPTTSATTDAAGTTTGFDATVVGTVGSTDVGSTTSSTTGGSVDGVGGSGAVTGIGGSDSTGDATGVGGAMQMGATTGVGGALATGGMPGAGGSENVIGSGGGGGTGGSASTCPEATPLTGGQEYCSNSKGSVSGSYGYELWMDGNGSGCMTVHGVEATFGASWNGTDDFLARVGLDYNQTQTHSQIGTISAEFAETKTEEGGGLTYIGIYGWTVNPLREFYILDDWGASKPGGTSSDGTPRDFAGTLTADGETYDVWTKLRENKPAITGDSETFTQYFSIRQTARQCGTISVSQHFSEWEGMGLPLGNLHEIKLLVESQDNSGSIEFTTANFVVN